MVSWFVYERQACWCEDAGVYDVFLHLSLLLGPYHHDGETLCERLDWEVRSLC